MLYRGICLLFFSKTDHTKEKMDEEMVHVVVIQFEINLFNRKKVMKNIILFKIWGRTILRSWMHFSVLCWCPRTFRASAGRSDVGAIHFVDFADLGDVDELVDQSLAVNLGKNSALVVIPERTKGQLLDIL